MDQFLISRTSDSLDKSSVAETGRGARYLQDCLFLLIRKSSPGREPAPRHPSPQLPPDKSPGLSPASCQGFASPAGSVGNPRRGAPRARGSFDRGICCYRRKKNVYLPVTKSTWKRLGGAAWLAAPRASPWGVPPAEGHPAAPSGWVLGRAGTNPCGTRKGPGQIPGCGQGVRGVSFGFVMKTTRAGFPLKVERWVGTWADAFLFYFIFVLLWGAKSIPGLTDCIASQ